MIYLITEDKPLFTEDYAELGISFCSVEYSLDYLSKLDSLGCDTETTGLDFLEHKLTCIQLGDKEKQFVIDTSTIDIQRYKTLLTTKELIFQNAKFDLKFLYKQNIFPVKVFDTFLAERILTTGDDLAPKSLGHLVEKYCGVKLDKDLQSEVANLGLTTSVIIYAAKDVEYLHQIKEEQLKKGKELSLLKTFSLDNEFVLYLAYVEYCGFYLNPEAWKEKCKKDQEHLYEAIQELNNFILENKEQYSQFIENQLDLFSTETKVKINWASSKQVIPIMKNIGIETLVKDKETGKLKDSIDKKVLEKQRDKHPLVGKYISYSEAAKVVSTYGLDWLNYISPKTRRIHTNFNQIMSTGRMSSGQKANKKKDIPKRPNLQNVPSDPETRHCFQSQGEDNILIVADYSGQEQILLVNRCLDEGLLSFYASGESDMHSFICQQIAKASNIFPKEIRTLSLDEIKSKYKKERQISKSVGFSINYGGTGITIAQNANLSLEEGNQIYDAYFNAFPGLASYFKREKESALRLGYIEFNSLSGRKNFIYGFEEFINLKKEMDSEFWENYKREKAQESESYYAYYLPKVRKYAMKKGEIERSALNFPICLGLLLAIIVEKLRELLES